MADIKEIDVLVAGAGPAGAIAARLLARHGRQVTLCRGPGTGRVGRVSRNGGNGGDIGGHQVLLWIGWPE